MLRRAASQLNGRPPLASAGCFRDLPWQAHQGLGLRPVPEALVPDRLRRAAAGRRCAEHEEANFVAILCQAGGGDGGAGWGLAGAGVLEQPLAPHTQLSLLVGTAETLGPHLEHYTFWKQARCGEGALFGCGEKPPLLRSPGRSGDRSEALHRPRLRSRL